MPWRRWVRRSDSGTRRTSAVAARRERGFALLVVIWVLALLAVLATGFAADTRDEARQARNLLENARAQAMAEAGVALAVTGLLDPNPLTQWLADGTARDVPFDGGRLHITVQDEGGKINLNAAPPELLAGLLAATGIPGEARNSLLDAIVARRRAAGDATIGMDNNAVLAAPESGPAFEAIDEIRALSGVSHATFDAIAPYITVFSRVSRVNPLTAPRTVLLSLPNVSPQEVEAVLAARAAIAAGQISVPIPFLTGTERYTVRTASRATTITVTATTGTGAVFVRQALLFLTGKPDRPYEFLDWRQVVAAGS